MGPATHGTAFLARRLEGHRVVSRGFVTYYGYLLALRTGLIQLPAYLESVNRDVRIFPASRSAYVRGRVIALWMDHQILTDSAGKSSLVSVMYEMVNEAVRTLTESRTFDTPVRYLS